MVVAVQQHKGLHARAGPSKHGLQRLALSAIPQPQHTLPTLAVSRLAFSKMKITPCCLAASLAFSSSCEGGCSPPATMH